MLRIESIKIINIGPIKDLSLEFDSHFNIICGMNGIGKTTILDCISQAFSSHQFTLKKTVGTEYGEWTIKGSVNSTMMSHRMVSKSSSPTDNDAHGSHGLYQHSNDVIVFKTHRSIAYQYLASLNTDKIKDIGTFSSEAVYGSDSGDIKNWFVFRHLWSAHDGHLDEIQIKNLEQAKKSFSLLNPNIMFEKIDTKTNDIILDTPNGEIIYEYLSSGYKSCIIVLLGLIKEIELRFKDPGKFIGDFDGIIFIDELDLHLHPEWQAKIYLALKEILPNAQLFTSTHSPHIVQVAGPKEIIPLVLDDELNVKYNPLINEEFGCQGWTVEEILKDVMGMTETRTELYLQTISDFNLAMDSEDNEKANESFKVLDQMLHPESSLRKVLKIQLSGLDIHD